MYSLNTPSISNTVQTHWNLHTHSISINRNPATEPFCLVHFTVSTLKCFPWCLSATQIEVGAIQCYPTNCTTQWFLHGWHVSACDHVLVQDDITCQISSKSFICMHRTPHKNAHQISTPNEVTRKGDESRQQAIIHILHMPSNAHVYKAGRHNSQPWFSGKVRRSFTFRA